MPVVSGSLKNVLGAPMTANIAKLVFRLSEPNVAVTGSASGTLYATKEEVVTPNSSGDFSVNLASTDTMLSDVWYELGIVWNEGTGEDGKAFWDFGLKIKVPTAGGTLSDLLHFAGGNGHGNQLLVWVNETPPRNPQRGQWWFQPSTNNLSRWE